MGGEDVYHDKAMIALLPIVSDWSHIPFPHLTLVYAGKITDYPKGAFNDLAKDGAALAMISRPLTLRVTGQDTFGPDDDRVDVFTLFNTPELMAMRRFIERWNRSEYKQFKPHVTIGPAGQHFPDNPRLIAFDRIAVCWGDEKMIFWMR